ncbi:MAG: hypothetical protein KDC95_14310 [Planctomycetes bacterium]|nr:hypothetical protein [Planctomycetota bacterium]
MRKALAPLAVLPVLAAMLPAQGSLHMLLGFAGDNTNSVNSVPIAGMYDQVDRNGKTDPNTAELFGFLRKVYSVNGGNGAFIYDEQHIIENGDISFYVADAGDGYILKCVDSNANGIIEDSEATIFTQFGTSRTFGPNTLSVVNVAGKVVVYTALDSRNTSRPIGIYRSEDKNNDGDASDAGETVKLLDSASALTFPGKAGTVTLARDDWQRIRTVPKFNRFFAFNNGSASTAPAADAFCYFGFEEAAGTLTKHSVFFNPSKLNGLPANADITSGALEDLDITFIDQTTMQSNYFNGFLFAEVDEDGDRRTLPAYYFTNTYGAKRSFGSKNVAGKELQGVVLRGVDKNLDGDLQDAGEVTVFFNGSGNDLKGGAIGTSKTVSWTDPTRGPVTTIEGFVTGLAEGEGVVYLLVENGSRDGVMALIDKNGNNVIETGEVEVLYETPSPFPPVFSSQFGPYSLELHAIDRSLVVDPLPTGAVPFGTGKCTTLSGLRPLFSVAGGVPTIGNQNLLLEMKRGNPNVASLLFVGASKSLLLGTIPLPFALDPIGVVGCNQLVSNELIFATLNGASGAASLPLPLPNDPKLKGLKLFMQWWSQDSQANPAQWVTSNGLEFTVQ